MSAPPVPPALTDEADDTVRLAMLGLFASFRVRTERGEWVTMHGRTLDGIRAACDVLMNDDPSLRQRARRAVLDAAHDDA